MLNLKRTCNWKLPLREKYPNTDTGKYGPEITPYLDTFHAVSIQFKSLISLKRLGFAQFLSNIETASSDFWLIMSGRWNSSG